MHFMMWLVIKVRYCSQPLQEAKLDFSPHAPALGLRESVAKLFTSLGNFWSSKPLIKHYEENIHLFISGRNYLYG